MLGGSRGKQDPSNESRSIWRVLVTVASAFSTDEASNAISHYLEQTGK